MHGLPDAISNILVAENDEKPNLRFFQTQLFGKDSQYFP